MRKETIAALGLGILIGAAGHALWAGRMPAAPPQGGHTETAGGLAGRSVSPSPELQRPTLTAVATVATSTSTTPREAGAAGAGMGSGSGTGTTSGGSAGPVPGASPSADEAIAAFRDLARAGGAAYGPHLALVERFRALDADGIALLCEFLRDTGSTGNRFLAAAILEALKDPRALRALDVAAADPDILVSRMASHALALLDSPDARPPLERALAESTDWAVRANAAYGLSKLGDRGGKDYLLGQFRRKDDPYAPLMALFAMADIGAPEFSAELRPFIAAPAWDLGGRLAAIGCAVKARDRDALPILEGVIAAPDTPDSLKEAAKRAVNAIRGERVYAVE